MDQQLTVQSAHRGVVEPHVFHDILRLVSRRHLLTIIVVLLGLSLTEGVGLLLLLPLLHMIGVEAGPGAADRVSHAIGWLFVSVGLRPTLGTVLGVYVVIVALQGALHRCQAVLSAGVEQDIVNALRRRVYESIARVEWLFFARSRSSDFMHILTTEIDRAGAGAYSLIDYLASAGTAVVYFVIAFRMSPVITSVVTFMGLLLAVAMRHKLAIARGTGEQLSEAVGKLYAAISEHLNSMKTAISYGAESRHAAVFAQLSDDIRKVRTRTAGEYGRFRQVLSLGSTVGLAVVVYVAVGILAVPTAELLVLVFVFARLMPRLTSLYEKTQWLVAQLPAFAAVCQVEQRCLAAARPRVEASQAVTFRTDVRFERVTFHYNGDGRRPAIHNLSLTIDAGSTTAFVGPSGSGKTTIADLLMGLVEPSEGRLRIDGHALTAAGTASWRERIGYVPQDTFLFHDTVRANLLWARPDATDDDLWHALRLAAADQFVSRLPARLDSVLGDRGVLMSGGERQRLSLARALLRQPQLLILDEATSSLDTENEERIKRAIDGLHQRMTIVIITHRLSTIRQADVIHVVNHGQVVESGTWDELGGCPTSRFSAMWRAQGLQTPCGDTPRARSTWRSPVDDQRASPIVSGARRVQSSNVAHRDY